MEQVPGVHHERGALQLAAQDLPAGGRGAVRRHPAQRPVALRGLQEAQRDEVAINHLFTMKAHPKGCAFFGVVEMIK